jgi:endonuclease YncB( thermonuclease family)
VRLFIALLCGIALNVQAETFSAKVLVVMDGDTVLVLHAGHKEKIRLANIDAPEKAQPFGRQSRESLVELVGKQQVQIESKAVDQYGRTIGLIAVEGRDINQEQVRRGMAWEYSHYHADKSYVALQSAAQQARLGLWSQPSPQAPWQWRKLHPSAKPYAQSKPSTEKRAAPVLMYDMECGKKARCSDMVSCDEAHFYLTRCGVKALDGNHDGLPCDTLCAGKH